MRALEPYVRWIFRASVLAMCALTFVWPITVSPDPSHAGFRFAAIAALIAFLASRVVLLACKARRIWAAAALVVIAVLAPLGFRLDG